MPYSPAHPSRKYPSGPGRYFGAATSPLDIRASSDGLRRASRSPIAWILSNLTSRVINNYPLSNLCPLKLSNPLPPTGILLKNGVYQPMLTGRKRYHEHRSARMQEVVTLITSLYRRSLNYRALPSFLKFKGLMYLTPNVTGQRNDSSD